MESHRSCVEAADLEEILHETLEPDDVALEQVECGLGTLRHLVAAGVHDLHRRGQRHQRGAQLVAHVGRESGVTVDSILECRGHVVERVRQHAQIRVLGELQPSVQPSAGDRLRGLSGDTDRSDRPSSGERTGDDAECRGDDRAQDEREPNRVQRVVHVVETEELEVGRVVLDPVADRQIQRSVDLDHHA